MVINMIYMININTEIFLRSVKDLNKLKLLVEVNNWDRPNFSAIARELGVDRRTVKKYYDGDIKKVRKSKKSKIDDFYDISFRVCFQQKRTKYFIINLISIDIWLEKKD